MLLSQIKSNEFHMALHGNTSYGTKVEAANSYIEAVISDGASVCDGTDAVRTRFYAQSCFSGLIYQACQYCSSCYFEYWNEGNRPGNLEDCLDYLDNAILNRALCCADLI